MMKKLMLGASLEERLADRPRRGEEGPSDLGDQLRTVVCFSTIRPNSSQLAARQQTSDVTTHILPARFSQPC